MLRKDLMAQNILLIEDDPSDANVVRDALMNSSDGPFEVVWVRRCSEGLERLTTAAEQGADPITAVLVDLILPDSHGIETFDRLFLRGVQDSDHGPECGAG